MKVVLAGNPNAGKTTLFNALTKSHLRTGNFHGVTTSPASKTIGGITYADVPGAYSFSTYSMEEKSALNEVQSADLIVNVVDALTLENSLSLTREFLSLDKKMLIYITKTRKLKRRKGWLDAYRLSQYLGVPVLDCTPSELGEIIKSGKIPDIAADKSVRLSDAYFAGNVELTFADKLFYNNIFSFLFFATVITLTFFLAFHPAMPGALMKDAAEELLCVKLCKAITSGMKNPALISLVEDGIFGGAGGVLSFLPQIALLYLVLSVLDESGITSALAFCTDGVFEKAGLSGRAAFSLVSGFGCTAAAVATTRGFSTPAAQKRTIAVLPFVPCAAKMPVFLTLLTPFFENPFPVITCFYFAGTAFCLVCARILGRRGEEMLSEVTPISFPPFKNLLIKLKFYLKGFIMKVAGTVTLFCIVSWFFSHFSFAFSYVSTEKSMLADFSRLIAPLFAPMGTTDWRIAYAALCGFIAKENVAATIAMLCPPGAGVDLPCALGLCAFLLLCPACISAFSASCREVGFVFTLKCAAVQLALAFAGGYITNAAFTLIL